MSAAPTGEKPGEQCPWQEGNAPHGRRTLLLQVLTRPILTHRFSPAEARGQLNIGSGQEQGDEGPYRDAHESPLHSAEFSDVGSFSASTTRSRRTPREPFTRTVAPLGMRFSKRVATSAFGASNDLGFAWFM